MRLSVAMCTYNGARFLLEQLGSIAAQSRLPDEMVICDDGSTDATVAILDDYARRSSFPVRIQQNPSRLGAAQNFGQAIALVHGDVIVLSDQDDVWRPDKLQVIEQVLSDNPEAGYVFSDALLIDEAGRPLHANLWEQVSFNRQRRALFRRGPVEQVRVLLGRSVVTGATMAFRASLRDMLLLIPDSWMHDEWIAFASSINGARGVMIQEPLTCYRRHATQAIGVAPADPPDLLKRAWRYFLGDLDGYAFYEIELQKWSSSRTLFDRTASKPRAVLPLLKAKAAHVAFRADLPRQRRPTRLALMAAEVIHRRYHRYSNGWRSVIKDLLVPTTRRLTSERTSAAAPVRVEFPSNTPDKRSVPRNS